MTMKRSGLFLLIVLFFALNTYAQFRVALAGGVNSSSVKESNDLPGWDSIRHNYSSRTGMHFGFIADLRLAPESKFYFQPGVFFYNKGRKYESPYDSNATVQTYSYSQFINYMDMPLNFVFKAPLGKKAKFMFGAGPYISFFYNGTEKSDTIYNNGDFKSNENNDLSVGTKVGQYKTFDFGMNALAGFEIGHIFLTANFSRGLSDFYTPSYPGHLNHKVIGGTLGIFLGKEKTAEPKLKDKDKDGVADDRDACPTEVGSAITAGCPDKDGDGIADKDDQCPNETGLLSNHGCPAHDTDKDGIADDQDKCPTVAGVARYNGCPVPDTDRDGVNDEEDKCPKVYGVVRYNGCPVPDTDGDGVSDEEDKCPTIVGVPENSGCPPVKKEIVEKVTFAARRIQFKEGKATLLPASLEVLDEVVAVLKQNQEIKLLIEGHTSNNADYDLNMKLSRDRAKTVKNYLIKKGIEPSRLNTVGYGPNKPLNSGKTRAEQAQNRRVELKVSNQ